MMELSISTSNSYHCVFFCKSSIMCSKHYHFCIDNCHSPSFISIDTNVLVINSVITFGKLSK